MTELRNFVLFSTVVPGSGRFQLSNLISVTVRGRVSNVLWLVCGHDCG